MSKRKRACDLCEYETHYKNNLKRHLAYKHDINVIYHQCNHCEYKAKFKAGLIQHLAGMHDIDVIYHQCDHCEYKAKQKSHLKDHLARMHDIDVIYHQCNHCPHQAKHKGNLKKHLAYKHDIGVIYHQCDNCEYQAKYKTGLKQHLADKHDIGVTYHQCDHCLYEAKQTSTLNRHITHMHDIGPCECELCVGKCAKLTPWTDPKTKLKLGICRKCYHKVTGYRGRIEKRIVEWLQKNFKHPMLVQDSTVKGEACLKYRPDIMYASENLVIYVEVDEHQHKYSNGSYQCDEKRMSDLYDETPGKLVVFVRYNPHTYKPPAGVAKVTKTRKELLLATLNYVTKNHLTIAKEGLLYAFYVCYSPDNTRIAQRISKKMVYGVESLKSIWQ